MRLGGTRTLTHTVSELSGGAGARTWHRLTVTVSDDDTAGVTITPTTLAVTEGAAAATYDGRALTAHAGPGARRSRLFHGHHQHDGPDHGYRGCDLTPGSP